MSHTAAAAIQKARKSSLAVAHVFAFSVAGFATPGAGRPRKELVRDRTVIRCHTEAGTVDLIFPVSLARELGVTLSPRVDVNEAAPSGFGLESVGCADGTISPPEGQQGTSPKKEADLPGKETGPYLDQSTVNPQTSTVPVALVPAGAVV